jgi:hypothetical protein
MRWLFIVLLIPTVAYSQQWQGFNMPLSYNNAYTSFYDSINQKLYVVGDYRPDNVMNHNHVCFYNGIKWDTLPGIFANRTIAVTAYNNEIYIGGYFEEVNGIPSRGLVKWNGYSFEYFGNRLNQSVTMLKVIDDKLLVGGGFSLADSIHVSGLAWYDGINFIPLPLNSYNLFQPFDAVKFDSMLIITGNIDDTLNYNIVCLKDGEWIDFPAGGIQGSDAAIADAEIFDNKLYVGGYFYKSWGNAGNFIQYFDGTSWKDVCGGTSYFPNSTENAQVHCLKVHKGKLYAGGLFNYAGDIPAHRLAVWDGSKWCGFGTSFNEIGRVFSIEFYKDTMFVFGNFSTINGIQTLSVAKWLGGDYVDTCSQPYSVPENNFDNSLIIYPNPCLDMLFIKTEEEVSFYEIYNSIGQKISEGNYNNNDGINVTSFAKGIYWVKILLKEKFYLTNFVKE